MSGLMRTQLLAAVLVGCAVVLASCVPGDMPLGGFGPGFGMGGYEGGDDNYGMMPGFNMGGGWGGFGGWGGGEGWHGGDDGGWGDH